MKKWIQIMSIVCVCVLYSDCVFASTETDIREGGVPALFVDGMVTKAPWQEDYSYIGVNNMVCILMPEVHIYKMYSTSSGAFQREDLSPSDLHKDDKLQVKMHGNRIFEIIVLEGRE
jgi:hypothetical protein